MTVTTSAHDVVLTTSNTTVKIAKHGAHVYSWLIRNEEQLFLSSASSINGPTPIRGGIPICFPVFGPPPSKEPYTNLKSHGFARNVLWKYEGHDEGEGWIEAKFSLNSDDEQVKKVFKPNFEILYKVKLEEELLKTSIKITNPSFEINNPLDIQVLFHNYLRLPSNSNPNSDSDPDHQLEKVRINGLNGLEFTDQLIPVGNNNNNNNNNKDQEKRNQVDFLMGEVDRIYHQVPSRIQVDYGNGKYMSLETFGLPDLTVWNPHEKKSNSLPDMEENGWKKFICIEPGHIFNFITIHPKKSWQAYQILKPSSSSSS